METPGIDKAQRSVERDRRELAASARDLREREESLEAKARKFGGLRDYGRKLLEYLGDSASLHLFSDPAPQWVGRDIELQTDEFYLFRIHELTFEEKAPRREAMENILGTFRGMDGISFIYLILGSGNEVRFYFGVAKDHSYPGEQLSAGNLGEDILGPSIRGNFRGAKIESVTPEEKVAILAQLRDAKYSAGILEGVPGTDEDTEEFQGVDRLVDVMAGDEFGFLVIARPYTETEIADVEKYLFQLADSLAPLARRTLNETHSLAKNGDRTVNRTDGFSLEETASDNRSDAETETHDTRSDKTYQVMSSANETAEKQYSDGKSFSLTIESSKSSSGGKQEAPSNSSGERGSVSRQSVDTYSHSAGQSDNTSRGFTLTKALAESRSGSFAAQTGESAGETLSDSVSETVQMELESKEAAHWLNYIDEVLLKRLDCGRGKGLFLSCGYLFAKRKAMLRRLANTAISLYSGSQGNRASMRFHRFEAADAADGGCLHALRNMQIPAAVRDQSRNAAWPAALSRSETGRSSFAGTWLSARELSILAALPQKEVPGLALREEVAFGLNVPEVPEDQEIPLGNLVQDGVESQLPIALDADAFDKHMFVTGVTGSGKTTTCKNLLLQWDKPFLVIEPAKTEYRALKDVCPDLLVFTPGRQEVGPFYLNPFELFPGEAITSRADMIKATLEASFDMEAAIPQIMETAVYRAYEEKGWDIRTNEWLGADGEPRDAFADGVYAFPTLSDFWLAVQKVTNEAGFGERLRDEYMGSLKARIESLLVGAKGMMLNNPRSLDFYDLVTRKVVIELEEIKNGAEKSLLMGFILTNLLQAVQVRHREDPGFRHITLVEEAHRLLSRYVPGDSMNKKQGVEVFADMLAEVRKYGESLIIVDQIPDKMTPEVLKNTNTKIVHKLFARDDKDTIGDTIALSDDQKEFLSKLPTGRAVVFSQGWGKAVQVQMKCGDKEKNAPPREIPEDEIKKLAVRYYSEPAVVRRGVLRGLEHVYNTLNPRHAAESLPKLAEDYLWLMRGGQKTLEILKKVFLDGKASKKDFQRLRDDLVRLRRSRETKAWLNYFYRNLWEKEPKEIKPVFGECLKNIAADDEKTAAAYLRLLRAAAFLKNIFLTGNCENSVFGPLQTELAQLRNELDRDVWLNYLYRLMMYQEENEEREQIFRESLWAVASEPAAKPRMLNIASLQYRLNSEDD